jgi:hypothetical protein
MHFASNWSRGLERLLKMWPNIIKAYPDATLTVAYGPETWGILKDVDIERIQSMIKSHDSVTSVGMLPYDKLKESIAESSFLLFPCDIISETFSIISAMAQQYGTFAIVR